MFVDGNVEANKEPYGPKTYFQAINAKMLNLFSEKISQADWDLVLSSPSADEAYDRFINIFCYIYRQCFPYKQLIIDKKSHKPWVTKQVIKMINKRNALYKKFLRTRNPDILQQFKQQRNKVTNSLRLAKHTY